MLQFWKKSKKDRIDQPCKQNVNGVSLPVGVLLPTLSDSTVEGPLASFHHDGYTDTLPPQQSRLSPTLSEALYDRVCLSSFSQYAEVRGFSPMVSLWLDLQELKYCNRDVNSGTVSVGTELRCGSTSESAISHSKLLQRYLSEDMVQKYRIPEDIAVRLNKDNFDEQALQHLQDFVFHMLKRELWHDYLRSEFFSKYQVELLTGGAVTLSDIMYHNGALAAFTEFLEQEGCQTVVEFWLTATNFQHQLRPDSDPTVSQNEAIRIYDKYLSLQATNPLGIDDATRCEVESRICVEGAAPSNDCMEPALRKAWAYLRYVCLPLFLSSQSYVQLISELMRATRANSSPASSVTDLSVDSYRGRYDPDVLWRRRNPDRGLSIGRIDQLGRFETDIEPEPDKKSEPIMNCLSWTLPLILSSSQIRDGNLICYMPRNLGQRGGLSYVINSRITRVVKRLVNKDEHKAQEEMAWRVAEMIVKDVTNLTMGGQTEDEEDM